jgi:predicted ArsR family transcriptional regulator
VLDELGFAPVDPDPGPDQIALTHCPFLELVEIGPGLVCQVHLGLMHGAVAAWSPTDADTSVSRLEPFSAPDRCSVHLAVA